MGRNRAKRDCAEPTSPQAEGRPGRECIGTIALRGTAPPPLAKSPCSAGALRERPANIEALTEALKPRQRFVVCADFGFHSDGPLDGKAIVRLASKVRLPSGAIRKMRRRAGAVWPAGATPSARLSHDQIGQLLDVSERQVHNIKRDALNTLRARAAGVSTA